MHFDFNFWICFSHEIKKCEILLKIAMKFTIVKSQTLEKSPCNVEISFSSQKHYFIIFILHIYFQQNYPAINPRFLKQMQKRLTQKMMPPTSRGHGSKYLSPRFLVFCGLLCDIHSLKKVVWAWGLVNSRIASSEIPTIAFVLTDEKDQIVYHCRLHEAFPIWNGKARQNKEAFLRFVCDLDPNRVFRRQK